MNWTPQMVETLATLARRRVSGVDIAETLKARYGVELTYSSVASKAWREGIPLISTEHDLRQAIARGVLS